MDSIALMTSLLEDPPWAASTVGEPLPNSTHACIVSLPTWASIVGYEEGDAAVLEAMKAGYPRFFLNHEVRRLAEKASRELKLRPSERVVLFPTLEAAQRAKDFQRSSGSIRRTEQWKGDLHALILAAEEECLALTYWQHSGEIVSSRRAHDLLLGKDPVEGSGMLLRQKIASQYGVELSDVALVESGMAAFAAGFRAAGRMSGAKPTLQLEFPYLDGLKLQEKTGAGVTFLKKAEGPDYEAALENVRSGLFSAVFCEVPSNPLLRSVDLAVVSKACREGGVPLIVDDTIASVVNVNLLSYADLITTSLTKWASGYGDVCGGSVVVNPRSPLGETLAKALAEEIPGGTSLYEGDAAVLAHHIEGLARRVHRANVGAEALVAFLDDHPKVVATWYPGHTTRENYDQVRRTDGGYGGLVSFVLEQADATPRFYDALQLCKGPSLGTEFTLVSPYPMLAHYHELDWAASCGIPPMLQRVSVGLEDPEVLIRKFADALSKV